MKVCVECDQSIDPFEEPHAAHEHDCPVDPLSEDWACRCDGFAHVRCCRYCAEMRDVIEAVSA